MREEKVIYIVLPYKFRLYQFSIWWNSRACEGTRFYRRGLEKNDNQVGCNAVTYLRVHWPGVWCLSISFFSNLLEDILSFIHHSIGITHEIGKVRPCEIELSWGSLSRSQCSVFTVVHSLQCESVKYELVVKIIISLKMGFDCYT